MKNMSALFPSLPFLGIKFNNNNILSWILLFWKLLKYPLNVFYSLILIYTLHLSWHFPLPGLTDIVFQFSVVYLLLPLSIPLPKICIFLRIFLRGKCTHNKGRKSSQLLLIYMLQWFQMETKTILFNVVLNGLQQ